MCKQDVQAKMCRQVLRTPVEKSVPATFNRKYKQMFKQDAQNKCVKRMCKQNVQTEFKQRVKTNVQTLCVNAGGKIFNFIWV